MLRASTKYLKGFSRSEMWPPGHSPCLFDNFCNLPCGLRLRRQHAGIQATFLCVDSGNLPNVSGGQVRHLFDNVLNYIFYPVTGCGALIDQFGYALRIFSHSHCISSY
jgi:hypothetical protein